MFSFSPHLASAAYVGIGFLVSYHLSANIHIVKIIFVVIHRLLHHPLSRYPGPFLAKLTDGYAGFYAAKRRLDVVTWKNHQKYGSVVRHGPDRLVFNSVTALRDIYLNGRVVKANSYPVSQVAPNVFDLFHATDPNFFRAKRRQLGAAFVGVSMSKVEAVLSKYVEIFMRQLMVLFRAPMALTWLDVTAVNIMERSKFMSYDIIWRLFSRSDLRLQLQTSQRNRTLVSNTAVRNYRDNYKIQFPFIHHAHLHKGIGRSFYLAWTSFTGLLKTVYTTCLGRRGDEQPNFHMDMADFMARGFEEEGAELANFWTIFFLFLVSAGDATATAISSAFINLARNPDCYRKLAKEIRGAFKNTGEVQGGPALSRCRYLRAVIDETLRMSPPVPGTLWRQLDPELEDSTLMVDGHRVPKGVSVGVNIYSIHHNEEYFPDPFTFSPERWIPARPDTPESGAALRVMREAFCPFSVGPRSCAGKDLVYLQISLVLARALWYFDFKESHKKPEQGGESGSERPEDAQLYNTFTSSRDGPYLVFRPRYDDEAAWR
ncbi:cytochrome P450 [Hypoxylon sp. NC0597]|nr:cytochrome P450 [Hypoxylon sp. NC0597]